MKTKYRIVLDADRCRAMSVQELMSFIRKDKDYIIVRDDFGNIVEVRKEIEVEESKSESITIWNGDKISCDAEVEYNVHYSDGKYHNTFTSKQEAIEMAARIKGYVRIVIIADLIS